MNEKKQVAEVDNDLDTRLKPKVFREWKQSQVEGSDLWHVMRISIGIDFSHFADLKEGKYCEYFEMC